MNSLLQFHSPIPFTNAKSPNPLGPRLITFPLTELQFFCQTIHDHSQVHVVFVADIT